MRRSHGFRSRTRQKLKGGHFSIAEALQKFKTDDNVRIKINPAVHSGMPHPRVQGRIGKVLEARGRAYIVGIKDGSLLKKFTCRPEHLKLEKIQKKEAKVQKKGKLEAGSSKPKASSLKSQASSKNKEEKK